VSRSTFFGAPKRSLSCLQPEVEKFFYSATNRSFNSSAKMASDEDYASFLDKANQDPNEGVAKTQSGNGNVELKAVDEGARPPRALANATSESWYVSDSDEQFVPVWLKFEGKTLPNEGLFFSYSSSLSTSLLPSFAFSFAFEFGGHVLT